ncbi:hypothetical protein ACLOJK_037693 [Asimina triloba]
MGLWVSAAAIWPSQIGADEENDPGRFGLAAWDRDRMVLAIGVWVWRKMLDFEWSKWDADGSGPSANGVWPWALNDVGGRQLLGGRLLLWCSDGWIWAGRRTVLDGDEEAMMGAASSGSKKKGRLAGGMLLLAAARSRISS